jgi:inner membrane protein
MAPLMALLPLLLVRLIGRPIAWKMAYLASVLGVASHLLLDLTNVYGIRLLLPFSAQWLRLDITSVVDPWIWAALLLAVIAPALARLVGSEIGAPIHPGRGAAILALSFMLLYNGVRAVIHQRALAILDSRTYEGAPPLRVAAFPHTFNPFAWRGLVEGPGFSETFNLNVTEPFDPTAGTIFYLPDAEAAIRAASSSEPFRGFLEFSQFPVWTVTPLSEPPNGVRVQATDLRFGTPRQPGFRAVATLDAESHIVRSWFSFLGNNPR